MKTFTYKQAIEVLNKYFKGYRIPLELEPVTSTFTFAAQKSETA